MSTPFTCTKCGECCRNLSDVRVVILFPGDIERLAQHLGQSNETFIAQHTEVFRHLTNGIVMRKLRHDEGRCSFLTTDNLCGVFEAQPTQCHLGPNLFMASSMGDYPCMGEDVIVADTSDSDIALMKQFFEGGRDAGRARN